MKLTTCSSCSVPIAATESVCPSCGARRRVVLAPAAMAPILLGLALAGCPAEDDGDTMGSNSASVSDTADTSSDSTMGGSVSMTSQGATTDDSVSTTTAQPPYGVPDTTGGGDSTDTTGTGGDSMDTTGTDGTSGDGGSSTTGQ